MDVLQEVLRRNLANTHSYFLSKSKITLKCFTKPCLLFSLTETTRASMVKLKYY